MTLIQGRSDQPFDLLELFVGVVEGLDLGKEVACLLLLLFVDQGFGEEAMHVVKLQHVP